LTLYKKSKIPFIGLLTLLLAMQCKTKSSSLNTNSNSISPEIKHAGETKFDTINQQLHNYSELMTEDLVEMNIIDTTITNTLGETAYCDTTIQLNDSIFYSIISLNDEAGVCTYFYIASINSKNKKVITSKYLHANCDVDYSQDSYELYDHKIISNNKIQLTKTTIFQKKHRASADEEENIDHKQTEKSYFTISQTGKIDL